MTAVSPPPTNASERYTPVDRPNACAFNRVRKVETRRDRVYFVMHDERVYCKSIKRKYRKFK